MQWGPEADAKVRFVPSRPSIHYSFTDIFGAARDSFVSFAPLDVCFWGEGGVLEFLLIFW